MPEEVKAERQQLPEGAGRDEKKARKITRSIASTRNVSRRVCFDDFVRAATLAGSLKREEKGGRSERNMAVSFKT